ncbi:hypothetical protein GCM10010912_22010 [Paenibacillus albidus]|uniref:Cyclic lactone autoinducer peptide n=1 Tax=Paenibacillus albidus TaxID=2041023 RepID=A0A917C906_9BACL|nr:cyclic lactone autoinducer peptide [Paenibacillus albidus]MBT2290711.1 cyclic lactone autoinducer peptide [Paenibacillus albidus]GGF76518.1 hypothetical protein GCM10010912_22010 [Paenibacillus albidus]
MKKQIAKHTSALLASSARFFAAVVKPTIHSPEIPKELRK